MQLEQADFDAAWFGDLVSVQQRVQYYKPRDGTGAFTGRVMLVAAHMGQLHIVQWLLTTEWANVSFICDGLTALMCAIDGGHLQTVQWLVNDAMASVDQIGQHGVTALLLAASHRRLDIVQWIVETGGANIDHVDKNNRTALLCAARWGSLDIVQWLIKTCGSNIQHMDENGSNALLLSIQNGNHDMINWLVTEGCHMHEDVLFYLRPEAGELPSVLMHTLLLEGPPRKIDIKRIIGIVSDKNSTKRMFARADKLRTRKPEWLSRKFAIVTESITKHFLQSLVTLVMSYSAPSVNEIWSTQLAVDSPRRNPVRATRQRRVSSSW